MKTDLDFHAMTTLEERVEHLEELVGERTWSWSVHWLHVRSPAMARRSARARKQRSPSRKDLDRACRGLP